MDLLYDWGTCPIHWVDEPKPEYEATIFQELEDLPLGPEDCHSLVTHTVILSEDYEGPGIHVWWDEKKDALMAKYIPDMKWETVDATGIVRTPQLQD